MEIPGHVGNESMNKHLYSFLSQVCISATSILWFGCSEDNPTDVKFDPAQTSSTSFQSMNVTSSSTFPASSSVAVPASEPFIDVEQEMANFYPLDTAGKKGICVDVSEYCEELHPYDTATKNYNTAIRYVNAKIDTVFASEKGKTVSSAKKSCYEKQRLQESFPIYGVSPCSNKDSDYRKSIPVVAECDSLKWSGKVLDRLREWTVSDDAYVNALVKNREETRRVYREYLEKVNENIAKCDSLDKK